jgi:hypothetical protein
MKNLFRPEFPTWLARLKVPGFYVRVNKPVPLSVTTSQSLRYKHLYGNLDPRPMHGQSLRRS